MEQQTHHSIILRPADGVDQPVCAIRILSRVICRRWRRSITAPPSCPFRCCVNCGNGWPRARPYNCYGQTEIAPLRHRAAAGRTRCPPGVMRTTMPERGNTHRRSGHERCAARNAWEIVHRSPHLLIGLLGQAGGNSRGVRRRMVSLRRRRLFRRGRVSVHRRSHPGRDQHRRRSGREPGGGGNTVHPPSSVRSRCRRIAGRQVDRGGDRVRRSAPRARG